MTPNSTFSEIQSAMHERGTTPHRWAKANGFWGNTVVNVIQRDAEGTPIKGPVAAMIRRKLKAFLATPLPPLEEAMPHSIKPIHEA